MPLDDRTKKFYDKLGAEPPSSQPHGTPLELAQNRERVVPRKWHQEGNKLIGDTDMGIRVVKFLKTDQLLVGIDANGNPVLETLGSVGQRSQK